ncbi:MAG: NAD(+) diphosphatase [Candidatus Rokubacteria bacterium]|nr:NAD(+) diphosphatase [Candidatus Rokubacteria bacterium]
MTTPLTVYLPFNRDVLREAFVPGKGGKAPGAEEPGLWLLVQEQSLLVRRAGETWALPDGVLPEALSDAGAAPFWLGSLHGRPLRVAPVPSGTSLPEGLEAHTMIPMRGTALPDELLSLGGMAMQLLWWESTSGRCPRCGEATDRLEGEWGKRCPRCRYEHYPHLHPAVITLVKDGDRCLLARKREWAPGRYALVAGFVDNGESLEGCVAREVKEEVGVDVTDIHYVGSQNWPFPSQLMIGFTARYAGGDIHVDESELEDARWFHVDELPIGPSRHSIAGHIIQHHAKRSV